MSIYESLGAYCSVEVVLGYLGDSSTSTVMSTMNRLVGFFFLCICMLVRLPSSSSAAAVVGHATATNTMIPPAKTQLPTNEIEKEEEIDTPRDVVIIGSGPSGCTAAIYTARAMLRPLVIAGTCSHLLH